MNLDNAHYFARGLAMLLIVLLGIGFVVSITSAVLFSIYSLFVMFAMGLFEIPFLCRCLACCQRLGEILSFIDKFMFWRGFFYLW